ncbi:hypothetical protein HRM2_41420 [Desulforapulum autotrophicum HRM2]|uniref:Uncharacterized protein n=1 Tax=Desulforapulum autotrophicum (strain ATCC 43914 / DSM 3382 / VKM B-1955 / HRM2) TaxID=177437 RepID=C0QCW7_DESAH|nr:hypothetical protein [Desulforapulum autotrophicum]ACN17199.1 hypothetical protein HRM2_41420 [Desulforapulum autotrophicum HRM2]
MPKVPCETGKIQQVLFNILQNGSQAMASFENKAEHIHYPPSLEIAITITCIHVYIGVRIFETVL